MGGGDVSTEAFNKRGIKLGDKNHYHGKTLSAEIMVRVFKRFSSYKLTHTYMEKKKLNILFISI